MGGFQLIFAWILDDELQEVFWMDFRVALQRFWGSFGKVLGGNLQGFEAKCLEKLGELGRIEESCANLG